MTKNIVRIAENGAMVIIVLTVFLVTYNGLRFEKMCKTCERKLIKYHLQSDANTSLMVRGLLSYSDAMTQIKRDLVVLKEYVRQRHPGIRDFSEVLSINKKDGEQ